MIAVSMSGYHMSAFSAALLVAMHSKGEDTALLLLEGRVCHLRSF
jgi:hypothetical protein